MRTSDLWLRYFLDLGLFMILMQTYSFHMYSSMFSSSDPSKREPGNPHSRKKSPVARQSATLTSLAVRINDLLRRLARFILALVTFEPSLWAISGMARSRGCPAAVDGSIEASSVCRA